MLLDSRPACFNHKFFVPAGGILSSSGIGTPQQPPLTIFSRPIRTSAYMVTPMNIASPTAMTVSIQARGTDWPIASKTTTKNGVKPPKENRC